MESSLTMASTIRSASHKYRNTRGDNLGALARSKLDVPGAGCNGPGVHVCTM